MNLASKSFLEIILVITTVDGRNPVPVDNPIIYKVLYIPGGVGGFNPLFSKIIVKLDHFPNFRGENKKYLKAPPYCHVF